MRSTHIRLALLALAAGLIAVLPASATAKPRANAKVTQVSTPFPLPPPADAEADGLVSCPGGTTLLGGGALYGAPLTVHARIYKSGPVGNDWSVRYQNESAVSLLPSAQAICLKNKLKVKGADGKPKARTRVEQVQASVALPPDTAPLSKAQVDATCPEGTTVVGGGASFPGAIGTDVELEESAPQGNGWHVRYDNDEATGQVGTATAICLKNRLKVQGADGKPKARSKTEQVSQQLVLSPNGASTEANVNCPEGTTAVGGGGGLPVGTPLSNDVVKLEESGVQGNAWHVRFVNDEATARSAIASAICLKSKLKVK